MKRTFHSRGAALCLTAALAAVATAACSDAGGPSLRTSTQALSNGTTGTIGDYTGLCLDTLDESGADGSWIQLATCNGAASQQWTYQNGQFVGLGSKCMDVFGGDYPDGTKVDLWDCNGGENQQWTLQNGQLVGVGGRCLDVNAFNSVVGQTMQIWDCNGGQNQQFVFAGNGGPGGGSSSGSSGGGGTSSGGSSGGGVAFVQDSWQGGGGTTSTFSNSLSNVAAGDLLLVWIDWDYGPEMSGQRTFQSIGDDAGNVYYQIDTEHGYCGPAPGGYDTTRMYWTINGSAGSRTVTFSVDNPAGQGTFIGSNIAEYTGEDQNDPVEAANWQLYLGSQNVTNPSSQITTMTSGDTVVGILGGCDSTPPTAGGGWQLESQGQGSNFPFGVEDAVVASPSTVTVSWVDSQVMGYGLWDIAVRPAP